MDNKVTNKSSIRDEECLIVFNSVHYSTFMYKLLKDNKMNPKIVLTPCTLKAGCSRAIKAKTKDIDKIKSMIRKNKVSIRAIYRRIINKKGLHFLRIL